MSRRHARAALAAASAAAAYYAAAALRSQRPVRLGAMFVLAASALAGTVVQGSRASAKAYEVEGRLNGFFNGGGQVGGDLVVNGNHTVTGSHTVHGRSNLTTINDNNGWVPAGNGISMSGTTLWLNGGTLLMQNGQIQTGGGQIIDKQGVVLQFP